MALAYVEKDVRRYLKERNLVHLPAFTEFVLFPYMGKQPPPETYFDPLKEEKLVPLEKAPFRYRELRWWIYPRSMIGDLPVEKAFLKIFKVHYLCLTPLCQKNPNVSKILKYNPDSVKEVKAKYMALRPELKNEIELQTLAEWEHSRAIDEAKRLALSLKETYPELFGETLEFPKPAPKVDFVTHQGADFVPAGGDKRPRKVDENVALNKDRPLKQGFREGPEVDKDFARDFYRRGVSSPNLREVGPMNIFEEQMRKAIETSSSDDTKSRLGEVERHNFFHRALKKISPKLSRKK
jgi:hypothetical protein